LPVKKPRIRSAPRRASRRRDGPVANTRRARDAPAGANAVLESRRRRRRWHTSYLSVSGHDRYELAHTIERAVLMADAAATSVAPRHLGVHPPRVQGSAPDDLSLEDAERVFIEKVLARHNGDVRL